jgi:hypothetical protein
MMSGVPSLRATFEAKRTVFLSLYVEDVLVLTVYV